MDYADGLGDLYVADTLEVDGTAYLATLYVSTTEWDNASVSADLTVGSTLYVASSTPDDIDYALD